MIVRDQPRTLPLPENTSESLPGLCQFEGRVEGVASLEVTFRKTDGSQITTKATSEQVSLASELGDEDVSAVAVNDPCGARLLVLESKQRPAARPSLEDIFDKWAETYRALS